MPSTVAHAYFAKDVCEILPSDISNELDLKRMLTTIASSCECYDSDSDISSNISSINNSPILKSNIYVVEKNWEMKKIKNDYTIFVNKKNNLCVNNFNNCMIPKSCFIYLYLFNIYIYWYKRINFDFYKNC